MFLSVPLVAINNTANSNTEALSDDFIEKIRPLTAGEAANWPTANSVVELRKEAKTPLDEKIQFYYSTSTVAALQASLNASVVAVGAAGDATLVAGTVNVAITGLTSANKVLLTRHTAGGTVTATIEYFYVVTTGQLTITAAVAAGTINTADTSVITYAVVA
jgi:hypothetical protein